MYVCLAGCRSVGRIVVSIGDMSNTLFAAKIPTIPCYTAAATSYEKIYSVLQVCSNVDIRLLYGSPVEGIKEKGPDMLY